MQFPKLKSGSTTQYPTSRIGRFATEVLDFVGPGEQRYRGLSGRKRAWVINLEMLDDGEAAALRVFFEEARGALNGFPFVDPLSGEEIPLCRLSSDRFATSTREEFNSTTRLIIEEV